MSLNLLPTERDEWKQFIKQIVQELRHECSVLNCHAPVAGVYLGTPLCTEHGREICAP